MASERGRWVGHLDLFLHIKNRPTDALGLPAALDILHASKIAGTTKAIARDQRWIVQLSALDVDNNKKIAVLLFLGIDKERAQAIYGNIDTLNLRTAKKKANEGGAISAHLVISTDTDKFGKNKSVLEDVEGLSRTRIILFLRALIYNNVQFSETKPDGKDYNVEGHLTADIVLDKPISQQLNAARLLSVDLIRKSRKADIDPQSEYSEKLRLIQFKPTKPSRGTRARRIISDILNSEKTSDYPEVRIRMEEDLGPQRTVNVNRTRETDVLMGAFQRRTLIEGFKQALPEASRVIITRLTDRMATSLGSR